MAIYTYETSKAEEAALSARVSQAQVDNLTNEDLFSLYVQGILTIHVQWAREQAVSSLVDSIMSASTKEIASAAVSLNIDVPQYLTDSSEK